MGTKFVNIQSISKLSFLTFVFFAITNLNSQIPILSSIPIESAFWILTLSLGTLQIYQGNVKESIPLLTKSISISLCFISSAILSSFSNQLNFELFRNQEFLHLSKFLVFVPFIFILFKTKNDVLLFIRNYHLFYIFLCIIFLFRYLILNEIRTFDNRPTINIRHGDPNFLSLFFTMIIPISIYLFTSTKSLLSKYYYAFSTILLIFCNFLTQSRAGILSSIITLVIILYFIKIKVMYKKFIIFFTLICVIVLGLSGGALTKRYSNIGDKSNNDRIKTYINGYKIIKEKPFFGTGFHQAKKSYYFNTDLFRLNYNTAPLEIHNTYLEVFAELGILGLISILILFIWPLKLIYLNLKSTSPQRNDIALYSICSLLGLFLCSMIVGIAYKDLFILHLFLLILFNLQFRKNKIKKL